VGLERGPLSVVCTTEEILERRSSVSGLENRDYGHWDSSFWSRRTLYQQTLAITSPTSDGLSVGIVCSRTKATELLLIKWHSVIWIQLFSYPITGRGGLQACEMLRIPHCIGSQIAVKISALGTGHALLPRNIIFLLLILISVRGWVNHKK
jgi:hypothetical protein